MTTPSADATSTPGAATGTTATEATASTATAAQTQGGDQGAAGAAGNTAAAATATATTEQPVTKGAEALFEGVIKPGDGVKADEKPAEKPATAPAAEEGPEWFLSPGVKGVGKPPEYFLADKYKTLADQAAAYVPAQKKLGAFTGAPEGDYTITAPEGVIGSIDPEHPMVAGLKTWAKEKNMSQVAFNELMGQFAQYEAAMVPTLEDIHGEVGDNAVQRIHNLGNWAKANLMPEEMDTFLKATQTPNAAQVIKAMEVLVAKTRQPAIDRTAGASAGITTLAEINAAQAKVNPATGKRFYEENPVYRAEVEKRRTAYFEANGSRK